MTNKEAIDRLSIMQGRCENGYDEEALNLAIKTLEERPTGEWIEDSGNIACSHCYTIWLYRKTDFCPNCGSKNEKRL